LPSPTRGARRNRGRAALAGGAVARRRGDATMNLSKETEEALAQR
jgi:hypothetical protein